MHSPENIATLDMNEIFVFGSNLAGAHSGGAARQAADCFGAEEGIGEGLTGKCYAFPTLERDLNKRGMRALESARDKLFATARALPEKTFLLTKVGCGIANYPEEAMARLFINGPLNILKPANWRTIAEIEDTFRIKVLFAPESEFRLEEGVWYCTHPELELIPPCCPPGTSDCGCQGTNQIQCPAFDCDGIQNWEVEDLFARFDDEEPDDER